MDTTEARDKAALLCVPDIYRQTERGINYSEWVRSGRGGEGVIHWSVWLIGGLRQRGEKTTAVGRMGLFQRGSLTLAEVWQPLHFSHLFLRAAASWIHYSNFCLTSKRSQHTIKECPLHTQSRYYHLLPMNLFTCQMFQTGSKFRICIYLQKSMKWMR